MAAQTASTVRAVALRSRCSSLAKTCSMGFRSGECPFHVRHVIYAHRFNDPATTLREEIPQLALCGLSRS